MKIIEKQERFLHQLEPVNDRFNRFCRAMTRSGEEAKDLASESILAAYERFEFLKNDTSFKSYLFQIASRTLKRRIWRKRLFVELNEEKAEEISCNGPLPDKGLEVEDLYASLEKLPRKMREAVVLFEISGFSIMEIAEMQGTSISAVKSRLSRGRDKLSKLILDDNNFEYGKQPINGNSSGGDLFRSVSIAQKVKQ